MQRCPICKAEVSESSRYPRYLCSTCSERTRSADGRLLAFSNVDLSGGFVATFVDRARSTRAPRSSWPQTAADGRLVGPKGHGAKTAAVRDRAITALLAERTIVRAARRTGVSERTLRRWLVQDEEFKAAYTAARCGVFDDAMNRIQVAMAPAVNTLEDLLAAGQPPAVRLGAARAIVELGLHRHEAETIMRKLHEIEARQRDQSTPGSKQTR